MLWVPFSSGTLFMHHLSTMENAMPTYEFTCKQCGKDFTLTIPLSAYDKKDFKCPECESKEVTQQISTFQVKTSKKS